MDQTEAEDTKRWQEYTEELQCFLNSTTGEVLSFKLRYMHIHRGLSRGESA